MTLKPHAVHYFDFQVLVDFINSNKAQKDESFGKNYAAIKFQNQVNAGPKPL